MKRAERRFAATLIAVLLAAAVFTYADDQILRRQLDNLHPRFVQNCALGTDESEDECESRWAKAIKP